MLQAARGLRAGSCFKGPDLRPEALGEENTKLLHKERRPGQVCLLKLPAALMSLPAPLPLRTPYLFPSNACRSKEEAIVQLQLPRTIKQGDEGTALVCLLPDLCLLPSIMPGHLMPAREEVPGQAQVQTQLPKWPLPASTTQAQVHLMPMWPLELSFVTVRQNEMSVHYSRTSNNSHNHMAFALLFVAIIGFLPWQSPGFVGVIRSELAIAGKSGLLLGQADLSLCDMPSEWAIGGKPGILPLQPGLSLGDMPSEPPLGGKTGILSWQSRLFLVEINVFGLWSKCGGTTISLKSPKKQICLYTANPGANIFAIVF